MTTETRNLVVRRDFAAPVAQVWRAWTDAQQVMRWWGPTGFTAPLAEMDVRMGGRSLVCMRSPDGHDFYNNWTYSKIVPLERLEFVAEFADKDGTVMDPAQLGLPPGIPRAVPHVLIFSATSDTSTTLEVTEFGYRSDAVVEMSRMGLEQCLDKMATSLATA